MRFCSTVTAASKLEQFAETCLSGSHKVPVGNLPRTQPLSAFSQPHLRGLNCFGLHQDMRRETKWNLLTRLEGNKKQQDFFAALRCSRSGTAQCCHCGSQTSTVWHLTHVSCKLNTYGRPSWFVDPPIVFRIISFNLRPLLKEQNRAKPTSINQATWTLGKRGNLEDPGGSKWHRKV